MAKSARHTPLLFLLPSLVGCAAKVSFVTYVFPALESTPFVEITGEGYRKVGQYEPLHFGDKGDIEASLSEIYSLGQKRRVLPSIGLPYLTVIPVDFPDMSYSWSQEQVYQGLHEAFFGDHGGNQYVSVAEYYDKASGHRLQLLGEVTKSVFRSSEDYATMTKKNNAGQTKSALTKVYNEAIAWYNEQNLGRQLTSGDAIYFVYLAPYSGMDGGSSSRSSMMWAFTINDPAPICWSSYYMMHSRDDGAVDAHTFIHEFGHMLGLKDYYDTNSYSDLSPCSPLGRMDMMDCSLGDHNAFSKMVLDWKRPYIPTGKTTIRLRQASGNLDCLLLPLTTYNNSPYDEYLLLEFYTPTYLNYEDSAFRHDVTMSLMKKPGLKVYHVDGRLGAYDDRGRTPSSAVKDGDDLGNKSLDLYCENSGRRQGDYAVSDRGFLIQSLLAGSQDGMLPVNFIASDHNEDIAYGSEYAHLRNVLWDVGQGIDGSNTIAFHKGEQLRYGFRVTALTAAYCTVECFPLDLGK